MNGKQSYKGCYPFRPNSNNHNLGSGSNHNTTDRRKNNEGEYSCFDSEEKTTSGSTSSAPDLEGRKNKNSFAVKAFERNQMKEHIMTILKRARPNAPSYILSKIPALADRLESRLFYQANSLTEYSNRFTLASRLKQVAKETPRHAHSKKPGKRQRPIFHNSSGDLAALANEPRKRAMNNQSMTSTTTCVQVLASRGTTDAQKITFHFTNHVKSIENDRDESDLDLEDMEDIEDEEDLDNEEIGEREKATPVLKILHGLLFRLIFEELTPMNKETILKEIVGIFRSNLNFRGLLDEAVAHSIIACMDGASKPETFLLHRLDATGENVKEFDINDIEIDREEHQDMTPLDTGLSSILTLCTEICGSPPVSNRLINTLLRLYKGRMVEFDGYIEWINPQFDIRILRRCFDRLLLSSPDKAPIVVKKLVHSWPENDSAAQGLFLTQIECIIRTLSQQRLIPLLECIIKRVAKCCIHGNGHLASHAISIAHKLIHLSGLRLTDKVSSQNLRYLQGVRQSFVYMRTLINANKPNYYNPELTLRAEALTQSLLGVL